MPITYAATVIKYNPKLGYGFVYTKEHEQDIMVHQSVIEMEGIEVTPTGLRALKVTI